MWLFYGRIEGGKYLSPITVFKLRTNRDKLILEHCCSVFVCFLKSPEFLKKGYERLKSPVERIQMCLDEIREKHELPIKEEE